MSVEQIASGAWRETIAARLAGGATFAGAWATGDGDGAQWHAALVTPGHTTQVLTCAARGATIPTIVDLVPAADWDEREADDLHGLAFDGHQPLRPLVTHSHDAADWTVRVQGDGVHQVAVGPIHAGVIESGHFRFHTVGEKILALDTQLFYKHRGLEREAEGRPPGEALRYAARACAACIASTSVAYAQAVEEALGLWPDDDLRTSRTLVLELERLYNHLHDIGALCSGVGFAPGAMLFAAMKDRAQEINRSLSGHRFLFGTVAVGTGALAVDGPTTGAARGALGDLRADAAAAYRDLAFAGSVQARLDGVGVLDHYAALRLGACGPSARAAGVRSDVRSESPRLAYSGFVPAAPHATTGDVAARLAMRALELETTCDILDDLLAAARPAGTTAGGEAPAALGVSRVESPRGATLAAVELSGGAVARLHLRTGSYANWPALAHAVAGNLLPDFPLINKSFELCYACVDR